MYNDPNFFYYNNPTNYGHTNYGGLVQKTGLFSKLHGIKWGDLLNNTSKCLNVINQAIPVIYQVKPLISNAKTMFKIANIIKSEDTPKPKTNSSNHTSNQRINYRYKSNDQSITKKEENNQNFSPNQPTFFL